MKFIRSYMAGVVALAGQAAMTCQAQVLEEITVTAQKREQNLQDIGISVTAISGEQIRELGLTSTTELASLTPGLTVWDFGNTPAVTVFSIRGVSQNDFADHNESPNAVYLDGAYASFVAAVGSQIFDVERVEVLRGPQGTLFGRNATGGLIHVISRKPTDTPEGYTEVTLGERNQIKFEGALGGPLSDTVSGRVSVATHRQDGFVRNRIGNDGGADDQYNARLQLRWRPVETVDALLSLRASRVDNVNAGGYDINPGAPDFSNDGLIDYVPSTVSNPTCLLFFGIPAPPGQTDCFGYTEPDSDPFTASFGNGNFERDYYGSTLTLEWTAGGIGLTWMVDGQWIDKKNSEDTDSTPLPVLQAFTNQKADQLSSEIRVTGKRGPVTGTAGLYFLRISGDYSVGFDSGLFGVALKNDYDLKTTSEAAFAQIDYAFSPAWTLTAGLRNTWDQKDFSYRPGCVGPGCFIFAAPGSAQVLGFVGDRSSTDTSAKLQLEWHATDAVLLYGGLTRGTKGGGFSAPIVASQAPDALPYGPEVLLDYEAGLKWTLPGGRTRINAGVFYYDYDGYQDYDTINITQVIRNKDASVRGGELEIVSAPLDGLSVSLGISALDATVKDVALPSGRMADRDMPQAPALSVTGLARKEWAIARGYLAIQGDFKYAGERYFRSINHPAYREGAYTVGNARVSFGPVSRRWEIAVFAKNVTDTTYRVFGYEDLGVNGVINDNYGPPRWMGVAGTLKW